jgi:hypothetical protein
VKKRRACKGTTKKGKPCGAPPMKDSDLCLSHDRKAKEERGFGGPQAGSGRPRLPTPTEVARDLVEQNIAIILRPHFRTLGFDVETGKNGVVLVPLAEGGAKLYGESREGVINASPYEDLGAQIAAADKLLDRIYGRPKQATELTGPGGGPIEHDHAGIPTNEEFQAGMAAVLAGAGADASSSE